MTTPLSTWLSLTLVATVQDRPPVPLWPPNSSMSPGLPPGTARPARLAQDLRIRARDRLPVPAAAHPRVRLPEPRAPTGSGTGNSSTAKDSPSYADMVSNFRQTSAMGPPPSTEFLSLPPQLNTAVNPAYEIKVLDSDPMANYELSGRRRFTRTSTRWTTAPSNPLSRLKHCHQYPLSRLSRNHSVAKSPNSKPSRFPGTSPSSRKSTLRPLKILGASPSSKSSATK